MQFSGIFWSNNRLGFPPTRMGNPGSTSSAHKYKVITLCFNMTSCDSINLFSGGIPGRRGAPNRYPLEQTREIFKTFKNYIGVPSPSSKKYWIRPWLLQLRVQPLYLIDLLAALEFKAALSYGFGDLLFPFCLLLKYSKGNNRRSNGPKCRVQVRSNFLWGKIF